MKWNLPNSIKSRIAALGFAAAALAGCATNIPPTETAMGTWRLPPAPKSAVTPHGDIKNVGIILPPHGVGPTMVSVWTDGTLCVATVRSVRKEEYEEQFTKVYGQKPGKNQGPTDDDLVMRLELRNKPGTGILDLPDPMVPVGHPPTHYFADVRMIGGKQKVDVPPAADQSAYTPIVDAIKKALYGPVPEQSTAYFFDHSQTAFQVHSDFGVGYAVVDVRNKWTYPTFQTFYETHLDPKSGQSVMNPDGRYVDGFLQIDGYNPGPNRKPINFHADALHSPSFGLDTHFNFGPTGPIVRNLSENGMPVTDPVHAEFFRDILGPMFMRAWEADAVGPNIPPGLALNTTSPDIDGRPVGKFALLTNPKKATPG